MTVSAYNESPKMEQAMELALEGHFVAEKTNETYTYSLYSLHDYYVETKVENSNHSNNSYKAFTAKELPVLWSDNIDVKQ